METALKQNTEIQVMRDWKFVIHAVQQYQAACFTMHPDATDWKTNLRSDAYLNQWIVVVILHEVVGRISLLDMMTFINDEQVYLVKLQGRQTLLHLDGMLCKLQK